MDPHKTYTAPTRWSSERPHTLVVCCSDGRWHAQMMEFVHAEVSSDPDLYAVPGGPAVLDGWNSSFDEARGFEQSMRLLVEHHDLARVWLIAHEGCAYYRMRHPHLDATATWQRQIADLRRGKQILLERQPGFDVRLIVARLQGDRVVFAGAAPVQEGERV